MPEDAPDQLAMALVSCCHEGSYSTGCHSVQGEGGQGEQEGDNLKETYKVLLLPSSKDSKDLLGILIKEEARML